MDIIFGSGIHTQNLNNPVLNKKLEKLGRQLTKSSHVTKKSNAGGLQAHAPDLEHPVILEFLKAATVPLQDLVKHYHIDGDYSFFAQESRFRPKNPNKSKSSFFVESQHFQSGEGYEWSRVQMEASTAKRWSGGVLDAR